MGATARLAELGIELPPVFPPAGSYVGCVVVGDMVHVGGHGPVHGDEIVRGIIAPGTSLDETGLARRFQVSRTPVREAIRLLAASGLIEARAHRAAVVARPSEKRLAGMFEAMAELEALCAERLAKYKRPVAIELLDGLPKNHVGKIDKPALRKL